MKIKYIESQYRRDFYAIYECEHCGHEEKGSGYDDDNFHRNVIPKTTVSVWPVRVLEVDAERRRVVASWNTNAPRTFYEREVAKWREKAPILVGTMMGGKRLATREEQKAARAAVSSA